MDLFSYSEKKEYRRIPIEGGELFIMEDFLSPEESASFFSRLNNEVRWRQETLEMYGKAHLLQRETAWYGDPGKDYTYSGITLSPSPWIKPLLDLKEKIERVTDEEYNTVLLNRYRSGNDKVGWHSDHEREFERNSVIASLSLGVSRFFDIRKKKEKAGKMRFELHSGTLLVMKGAFQHNWEHQVPVQKKVTGVRINLTYRRMIIK